TTTIFTQVWQSVAACSALDEDALLQSESHLDPVELLNVPKLPMSLQSLDLSGSWAESEQPPVRRAQIPPDLNFETMAELGRDLTELSREIDAAGQVLTSEAELEQELARRRGGYMSNGDS